MNLPNAFTVGRIAITPLVAVLPFVSSSSARLSAFVLFLAAASSDYVDGVLARRRKQETDLGRMLDPLADKLLLVGTFVPMFILARSLPFVTPFGSVGFPWWILAIVLGREVLMTVFRQYAARRGVIISAIGPAKLKTIFQYIWQGAAYYWFFLATLAAERDWTGAVWTRLGQATGIIGVVSMVVATALTVYSLWLYFRRFGGVLRNSRLPAGGGTADSRRL